MDVQRPEQITFFIFSDNHIHAWTFHNFIFFPLNSWREDKDTS